MNQTHNQVGIEYKYDSYKNKGKQRGDLPVYEFSHQSLVSCNDYERDHGNWYHDTQYDLTVDKDIERIKT